MRKKPNVLLCAPFSAKFFAELFFKKARRRRHASSPLNQNLKSKTKSPRQKNCRGRIYKKLKIRGTTHDLRQMPPHLTLTVSSVSHTDATRVLFALKSPFGQLYPPRSHHPRLSVEKGADLLFFLFGLNINYNTEISTCQ